MTQWKDPEIAAVRALMLGRQPAAGAPPPTLQARRAAMDSVGEAGSLPPGCFHEPVVLGGVKCERIIPLSAVPGRVVLYLHGGGYTAGSPRSHRPMVARLADASHSAAVVPDYRLGPEHRFPAAVDDALAVYRALLADGVDPDRMMVAGDSAGGGLALALALALKRDDLPQPAGLFVISPWADLTQSHATYRTKTATDPMITKAGLDQAAQAYLGGLDAHDPLASPVFGDFIGLPPILIQTGSEEALLGDSLMLADVAGQARVAVRLEIWPEMIHVFQAWSGALQAGRQALRVAGGWIGERLG